MGVVCRVSIEGAVAVGIEASGKKGGGMPSCIFLPIPIELRVVKPQRTLRNTEVSNWFHVLCVPLRSLRFLFHFLYIFLREPGIAHPTARPHPADTRTEETVARSAIATRM